VAMTVRSRSPSSPKGRSPLPINSPSNILGTPRSGPPIRINRSTCSCPSSASAKYRETIQPRL